MEVRDGTMDAYVVREVPREYGLLPVAGFPVLDIGGHIGAFGRWAIDNGAASVDAYEAHDENAALYRRNVPEARVTRAAVIGGTEATVTLNVSTGSNTGSHSIFKKSKTRYPVEVPAVQFKQIVSAYTTPFAMKIDVEGAEYDFLMDLMHLPATVRAIAMELHLGRKAWWGYAERLTEAFALQGFRVLRSPRFTPQAWHVQGVWVR